MYLVYWLNTHVQRTNFGKKMMHFHFIIINAGTPDPRAMNLILLVEYSVLITIVPAV